jgi:hypothetical protein
VFDALGRKLKLNESDATIKGFAVMRDQPIPKTKATHAFEEDGAPGGFRQQRAIAEAETRITDRPIAQGIEKFPQISPAGIVKALQHHSNRRPARMGAKETILVYPILGEQRGEALAVICRNGSGEGGQQIRKRQASHLVVLICRDPFWTAVITKEPIIAPVTQTRESGFKPTPLHRIAEDFLRKEVEAAGLSLWQSYMARTR